MSESYELQEHAVSTIDQTRHPLILVQNCDGLLLELFEDFFNHWGYTNLLFAHRHADVEILAEENDCDLIIMDAISSGCNGMETTATLKSMYADRGDVFIIGVAGDCLGTRERFMEAGADAFLGMPFPMDELLDLVRHVLSIPASRPRCT